MLHYDNSSTIHPNHLLCPITLRIFLEPVIVLPGGIVYELEAIHTWIDLAKSKNKVALCPQTNLPISGYIAAYNTIAAVDEYLKVNPEAKVDQYIKSSDTLCLPKKAIEVDYKHDAAKPVVQLRHANDFINEEDRIAIDAAQAELDRLPSPASGARSVSDNHLELLWEERMPHRHFLQMERPVTVVQRQRNPVELNFINKRKRAKLIREIQDLSDALGLGHLYGAPTDTSMFPSLHRAAINKIRVDTGPRDYLSMRGVLEAAVTSLKELNPEVLSRARDKFRRKFDCVWVSNIYLISLGSVDQFMFDEVIEDVKFQPGFLIFKLLSKVDLYLVKACERNITDNQQQSENHNGDRRSLRR